MTHVRKQHTVPQFLLKNFSNKEKTHIWSFDKNAINNKWNNEKNRAIKSTPTEEFFYDKVKGEVMDSLEYKLREIETQAEPIVSHLIESKDLSTLTIKNKEIIAEFVACQMYRTRESLNDTVRFVDDFIKPIEGFINKKINLEPRDTWYDILNTASEFKSQLLNKTWVIAESDEQFYISDNPVVLQNSTHLNPNRGNLGLKSSGVEIYIPLSSSIVLCLFCEKAIPFSIPNVNCDTTHIENLNWLQVQFSSRFVFSQHSDFKLIEDMVKERKLR